MMNNNIDIDTVKLQSAINKQRDISKRMSYLFEQIKNNNESLKDSWNTKTSSVVFDDFNSLYKVFENVNDANFYYSDFLENIVSSNYVFADDSIGKDVDSKIAIE